MKAILLITSFLLISLIAWMVLASWLSGGAFRFEASQPTPSAPQPETTAPGPVRDARAPLVKPVSKGTLHGRIRTTSGSPWAHGTVRVASLDFDDWNREIPENQHVLRTDAKGRFALESEVRGPARLELLAPGVVLARRLHLPRTTALELVLPAPAPPQIPEAPAGSRGSITAEVRGPAGEAVTATKVQLFTAPNKPPRETTTNSAGRCSFANLPACQYVLCVQNDRGATSPLPRWNRLSRDAFRRAVDTLDSAQHAQVTLSLRAWSEVRGTAVTAALEPVPGATVQLDAAGDTMTVVSTCDDAGRFTIRVLPGHSYVLGPSRSRRPLDRNREPETHAALAPGQSRGDHRVTVRAAIPFHLVVRDDQNQPLADARVTSGEPASLVFSSNSDDYFCGSITPQRTDALGQVQLQVWPGLWYLLFVRAKGFSPSCVYFDLRGIDKTVPIPDEVRKEVRLTPSPTGELAGRVLDEAGQPVEGAVVRAHYPTEANFSLSSFANYRPQFQVRAISDEFGAFRLQGLRTVSSCTLHAHADGFVPVQVSAVAGTKPVLVTLKRPAPLRRRVVFATTGVPAAGLSVRLGQQTTTTDKDGHFQITNASGGNQTLYVQHPSIYSLYRSTTGLRKSEEDLAVTPRALVEGQLLDPAGQPVRRARLRVRCWFPIGRGGLHERLELTTDQEGRYRFFFPGSRPYKNPCSMLVEMGDLPGGAWSPWLARAFDAENPPATLRFEAGKQAVVRILDAAGKPVPKMFLALPRGQMFFADAAGRVRLTGLPSTTLKARLHADFETLKQEPTVEVTPGGPEIEVRVRRKQR